MNTRNIYFFSALIVTITSIALLVTGSSVLTISLNRDGTIPLGTFITWAGMIALPLAIYWGIEELRRPSNRVDLILSRLLMVIIILGILWVPISYLLAGNISFSFSEKESFQGGQDAMRWFWRISYGIPIGAILILFVYWITLLARRK